MSWKALGQKAALQQFGLEKIAVKRAPRPDGDLGDEQLPLDVRRELLQQHIGDVKAHQMAPLEDYQRDARESWRTPMAVGGGVMGGLYGLGLAGAAGHNPLLGGALGLGAGALGGYGLGHLLGGSQGRSDHSSDLEHVQHIGGLENRPHGVDRELAALVRQSKQDEIDAQRDHDREIAHMQQRRINYNVDAGRGSPLHSYPYMY